MRFSKLSAVASALVIGAVPAVALAGSGHGGPPHGHPGGTSGPSGPSGPTGPGGGHRHCRPHSEGYVASGTLVSSSLTKQQGKNRYSGMLTVSVTHTNHHGAGDKGMDVTYMLDNARVVFSHGTSNPPAAGDRVHVIGRITELNKRCDQTGFKSTVTVRQVVIHAPKPSGPTGPSGPSGPSGPTGS